MSNGDGVAMDTSAFERTINTLEASLDSLEVWLLFMTALVVIGLVLEYWYEIPEAIDQLRKAWSWKPILVIVGGILITVGVAGELVVQRLASRKETDLRKANDAVFAVLNTKAGNAKASADGAAAALSVAQQKLADVTNKSDALTLRLARASNKVDDIEQDTLALGPRWRLLERGKDIFIKALKPFAGQRVTVVICGNGDVERFGLEQQVINMFREAGWDSPDYKRWTGCPNMLTGGNEIYFVPPTDDVNEWTGLPAQQWLKPGCGRFNISHDAVDTLCDVLYELRIFTSAWREKPLPKEIGIQNARLFFGGGTPDGPAELAYKDPGRIFFLVGPNAPMFADKNKHPSNGK